MSVHLPVLSGANEAPLRRVAGVPHSATDAGLDRAVTRARRRSGPGLHREPGSNPWRTGMREIVMMLSRGRLEIYRPLTRSALVGR